MLPLQMGNGGSRVWEQPAALQQLPCQPRGFGVSSQKFSSPQVGLESAGSRKTAAVSYSQPPLAGFSKVSPGKPPDLPRVSKVLSHLLG